MDIRDFKFKVYSQNGEDGILDLLIEALDLDSSYSAYPRAFIEFGVENYRESNTRYLLRKRRFAGLVMDGSLENIKQIKADDLVSIAHDLEARCAFITRENINSLLEDYLRSRDLSNVAILSIDIDGVDYFVWEAIKCVEPAIVVIEFNAIFGANCCVSVPYRADFNRFKAHHSGLYFGASLPALLSLGIKKGYVLVGCDRSGTNTFFIHKNLRDKFPFTLAPLQEYCLAHDVCQSRDIKGNFTYLSGEARLKEIAHLPLHSIA
ncbi:hypothetical protein [Helicobacter suis]|uniref:hypothetical protein n=1 Tax=Helicobacter suis TaxID=104628 RepID=UPI0013D2E3C0|nr:hypothetical protein [Helicobacter suis]